MAGDHMPWNKDDRFNYSTGRLDLDKLEHVAFRGNLSNYDDLHNWIDTNAPTLHSCVAACKALPELIEQLRAYEEALKEIADHPRRVIGAQAPEDSTAHERDVYRALRRAQKIARRALNPGKAEETGTDGCFILDSNTCNRCGLHFDDHEGYERRCPTPSDTGTKDGGERG